MVPLAAPWRTWRFYYPAGNSWWTQKQSFITPSFLVGKQLHNVHNMLSLQHSTQKLNIIPTTGGVRRKNYPQDPPTLPTSLHCPVMNEILDVYLTFSSLTCLSSPKIVFWPQRKLLKSLGLDENIKGLGCLSSSNLTALRTQDYFGVGSCVTLG